MWSRLLQAPGCWLLNCQKCCELAIKQPLLKSGFYKIKTKVINIQTHYFLIMLLNFSVIFALGYCGIVADSGNTEILCVSLHLSPTPSSVTSHLPLGMGHGGSVCIWRETSRHCSWVFLTPWRAGHQTFAHHAVLSPLCSIPTPKAPEPHQLPLIFTTAKLFL